MNIIEAMNSAVCAIIGLGIMVIPYTRLHSIIGGGMNNRVDLISKILFVIYGGCMIILDKPFLLFINNLRNRNTNT